MQRLLFGRLALMCLLLLGSWWWVGSYLQPSNGTFPTGLFIFFLVAFALTGIYHVVAWFNSDYATQRRLQFFVDIFLVTWLVRETGDVGSPYVSLYIVLICLAGFMLDRKATLAITFISAGSFIVLAVLTGRSIIYSLSADVPTSRSFQVVGFNTVAILFVGLIAARIAERKRIAEDLRRSRENFADLNILHERIVQSVDTGLVTFDLDGCIYGFNRAASAITGYSEDLVRGKKMMELFGEDLGTALAGRSDRAGQKNGERFDAEIATADGRRITVLCSISPLYRRTGEVSGSVATFQDVSQIRALEASLRRCRSARCGRQDGCRTCS